MSLSLDCDLETCGIDTCGDGLPCSCRCHIDYTGPISEEMQRLRNQIDFCEREMNNFRRNARYAVEDIIAALNERVIKAEQAAAIYRRELIKEKQRNTPMPPMSDPENH